MSFEIPAPAGGETEAPRGPQLAPRRLAVVALVAALVAAVVGGAWWFLSDGLSEPANLALSFPRKGSQVFRMGATLDWQSDSRARDFEVHTEFEGILTLRTLSADGEGARLRAILDISRLSVNGRPITKPPTVRSRMRMGRDGTAVRGGYLLLPNPSPPIMLTATGLTPDLSDRPVSPGDSWTDSVNVRAVTDLLKGTAYTRFLRYENVGGVAAAVLEGTRELRIDGGPPLPGEGTMTVNQTAWVNPKSGEIMRMTAEVRFSFRSNRGVLEGVDRYELKAV